MLAALRAPEVLMVHEGEWGETRSEQVQGREMVWHRCLFVGVGGAWNREQPQAHQ